MAKRILIVEDEAIIALDEARTLTRLGYEVGIVGSGEEAIAKVESGSSFDLICMDIDLGGGIDGTEAAQRILLCQDIPIVFLSSHTEPEIVEKTDSLTSYGYVVKNTGETVLATSLKMAFRLHDAHRREKAHEEALREERNLLRTVIDNLPDAIYVKDARRRKILANPAELSNMGAASEAEIHGKIDEEVYPPALAAKYRRNDELVLRTGRPLRLTEEVLRRPDGEERWLETSKVPLRDSAGKIIGLVGIGRDVTERRRAEDAFRAHARQDPRDQTSRRGEP